jgi:CubicO group peptidase (beta-lactamase class C family)
LARDAPVTPDTVFQVGSISKSVTAWGVMRLVQQHKLDLDAPVERYLTRWHLPHTAFDVDGGTIGRLLSHSAGLNSQDYSPISTRPLPSLEQSLSGESGGVNARSGTDDVRITMTPGQHWNYSNGGYTLLQLAIEEVTGEAFARYMQREVLEPLGMTRSSFTWQQGLRAQSATGYDVAGRAVPRSALTETAAGGLQTTANDLAVFMAAGMIGPDGEPAGRGVLTPTLSPHCSQESVSRTERRPAWAMKFRRCPTARTQRVTAARTRAGAPSFSPCRIAAKASSC